MAEALGVNASQRLPLPLSSWPKNRPRQRSFYQQQSHASFFPVRDQCVHTSGIPVVPGQKGPAVCGVLQKASCSLNQKANRIEGPRPDELLGLEKSIVPQQFASTHAQLLLELVNRETEAHLQQLKSVLPPSSLVPDRIPTSKQTVLKKRHSASFHYQPPDLGQADLEDWLKKRNKKSQQSQHVGFAAFGRTINNAAANQRSGKRSDEPNENHEKDRYSSKGLKNARKDVMDKLHNYRINAQARLLLEKRAGEGGKVRSSSAKLLENIDSSLDIDLLLPLAFSQGVRYFSRN